MISTIRFPSSTSRTSATRPGTAAGAGNFTAGTGGAGGSAAAAASKGVVPSHSVTSVDAVMALQGADDPAGRKARAMKRGTRILDDLDELKIAVLEGRIDAGRLNRIVGLVSSQREASGNEGLDDVLDGIDLRARVELAKLGR